MRFLYRLNPNLSRSHSARPHKTFLVVRLAVDDDGPALMATDSQEIGVCTDRQQHLQLACQDTSR
jgi:hypothetical protein